MRIRSLPLVLIATSTVVLSSCTAPDGGDAVPLPAPTAVTTTEPTASTEPAGADADASSAETALVADYLAAVAAGDAAAAWEMLTPEAQESAASFASYSGAFGRQGTVSPEEAERLRAVEPSVAEGPEGAFTLVSAVDRDIADAWIVRDTDQGLRLDDHVVPATGATPYEWRNPAAGPEESSGPTPPVDVSQPITLSFAVPEGDGGLVGFPEAAWAWVDGAEVPVEVVGRSASRELVLDTSGWSDEDDGRDAVTVVWQVGPDSLAWRSTTVAA